MVFEKSSAHLNLPVLGIFELWQTFLSTHLERLRNPYATVNTADSVLDVLNDLTTLMSRPEVRPVEKDTPVKNPIVKLNSGAPPFHLKECQRALRSLPY
jgi:hypothetical protein